MKNLRIWVSSIHDIRILETMHHMRQFTQLNSYYDIDRESGTEEMVHSEDSGRRRFQDVDNSNAPRVFIIIL